MFGALDDMRTSMKEMQNVERKTLTPSIELLPFDADSTKHTFDDLAEKLESLGSFRMVDFLTDQMALGTFNDVQAHCLLWPVAASLTHADTQYHLPSESPREHGTWHDETGKFSLTLQLENLVNPRWARLKDLGNAALKVGEFRVAVDWYKRAESLTDVGFAVRAFFDVVNDQREASAACARLADAEADIKDVLFRFLPDGPKGYVSPGDEQPAGAWARWVKSGICPPVPISRAASSVGAEPNLPRATCLANAAAALLKAGDSENALECALDASDLCPEYIKGQHRLVACWRAVGKPKGLVLASDLEESLKHMGWMRGKMATTAINMLALGWISAEQYAHVYAPAFFTHEARLIAELRPRAPITCLASLVPLGGGQWLTVGVQYHSVGANMLFGGGADRRHDCMHFVNVDPQHGDRCEEPPHGHASEASARRFPAELIVFLRLLSSKGIQATHLCLGQGLMPFKGKLGAMLKRTGYGDMEVYTSHTTHASKVQEMGVEAACGIMTDADGNVRFS